MKEEVRKIKKTKKQKTSEIINKKILIFSLITLAIIGTTYYFLDNDKIDILNPLWAILAGIWYCGILFAIFFVKNGTRLGSMIAGIIGWITFTFWIFNNMYLISDNLSNFSYPNIVIVIRNIVGSIVAGLCIATSHNLFHKIRMLGK